MHNVTRRVGSAPILLALAVLELVITPAAHAGGYTFQTVDAPGAAFTETDDINDAGQFVGNALNFSTGNQGFFYDGATFQTLAVPGAIETVPFAINNQGLIAGFYGAPTAAPGVSAAHGFLYDGTTYTTFDVPSANNTEAFGINNLGQVAGTYETPTGAVPPAPNLTADHGFVFDGAAFQTLDVPGASGTIADDVNNGGQVVGSYDINNMFGSHGFVFDGKNYQTLDAPGAVFTSADGINDAGLIAGTYTDAATTHGFVYDGIAYTTLDAPGAAATQAFGLNNKGQVVGDFFDPNGIHGFIATPNASVAPEPSSVADCAIIALIATGLILKARKRRAA